MKTVMALLIVIVLGLLGGQFIATPLTSAITTEGTDTETVTTGAAITTGTVTLATAHWYSDTTELTIVCATDGDVTAGATVAANRKSIALTGLTAATTQVCVTTYQEEDAANAQLNIVLKTFPFLILMAVVAAGLAEAGLGGAAVLGKREGTADMLEAFIVVFFGVVLLPVVLAFISDIRTTYTNMPAYIGVLTILPIVGIAYVLALLGVAMNAIAPKVKNLSWSS